MNNSDLYLIFLSLNHEGNYSINGTYQGKYAIFKDEVSTEIIEENGDDHIESLEEDVYNEFKNHIDNVS